MLYFLRSLFPNKMEIRLLKEDLFHLIKLIKLEKEFSKFTQIFKYSDPDFTGPFGFVNN